MPAATDEEVEASAPQTTDPAAQVENAIPQPAARPAPAPVPAMPMRMPRPSEQYRQGGLTFTAPGGTKPAGTGFDSPDYQRQVEAYQMQVIQHAKNVREAEKDVMSARKMLGVLKADREIAAGVPPDQAIFKNLHLLTTPGSAQNRMAQPVPKPYGTEITAGTNRIPAIVTPGPGGAQHTQIVPRSAMPQPDFKPSVEEVAPGVKAIRLSPNRYQLLERPNVRGTPSELQKVQHEIWKSDLTALQRQKGKTPIPEEQAAIQTKIDTIERKMLESARGGSESKSAPAKGDRVTIIKSGKKFTVPRSQLDQAVKEGYAEVK